MFERRGFDKIIGQELAKRILIRAVRGNEPSHAYLFLGLQGTGKTTTAIEFATALNCENPRDGHACGECVLCRAIEHGNFPDIRIWSPEGQNTKIDQMREMRELAVFKPMRGRWKVNIIEQGDTMNEESANCILKLLEEPPAYLINILLFKNAANALPTIRSRCQMVRFAQANVDELASRLVEDFSADPTEAEFFAAYSQGRPGAAIQLIGNSEFFEKRDVIIKAAANAARGDAWLALRSAEMLRSSGGAKGDDSLDEGSEDEADAAPAAKPKKKTGARDAVIDSLDILLVWYRDLLASKLQGSDAAVINSDKRKEIESQSACYPHAGRLANAVEAIISAKRGILGNGNPQIVTETLMMRITL